jgi:MerR family transcriptional regulator, light-induced transcriptional regulator
MGGLSGDSSDDQDEQSGRAAAPCLEEERWLDRRQHAPEDRVMQLTRTIEAEIIPRLLLSSKGVRAFPDAAAITMRQSLFGQDQIEELSGLIVKHDTAAALAYIENLRARGAELEGIFLYLLAPAARYLGDLWTADLRNFADVTIGLSRLQQVLRALSPAFENELDTEAVGHRALLVPARGEQHTFGLFMLEEFFRRAGWDVWGGASAELDEISSIISREYINVVGFSLSCSDGLDDLAADIKTVRRSSQNPSMGILVGGPAFIEHPERVGYVGADGTAADGQEAVSVALKFVGEKAKHSRS